MELVAKWPCHSCVAYLLQQGEARNSPAAAAATVVRETLTTRTSELESNIPIHAFYGCVRNNFIQFRRGITLGPKRPGGVPSWADGVPCAKQAWCVPCRPLSGSASPCVSQSVSDSVPSPCVVCAFLRPACLPVCLRPSPCVCVPSAALTRESIPTEPPTHKPSLAAQHQTQFRMCVCVEVHARPPPRSKKLLLRTVLHE